MNETIRIDIVDESDRFARFRLIPWWDQSKISNAKILVIGAGALGNEIIKNLALLGFEKVFIIDMDTIENSNLSRSILFREKHNGRMKAEVASVSAKDIYNKMNVQYLNANICHQVGLGVFRWADVVIAGLDNREARFFINKNCWRVGTPWIDGAIEGINGIARLFVPPDGPCYECTLNSNEKKFLDLRRSCNLLTRQDMLDGKTPTTPTSASIIAGIQCQELLKLLHGMPTLKNCGFIFDGLYHNSYKVTYEKKDECESHETFNKVIEMDWSIDNTTVSDVLAHAKERFNGPVEIDTLNDLVESFECLNCNKRTTVMKSLGSLVEKDGICPECNSMRVHHLHASIDGSEGLNNKSFADLGIPAYSIICARRGLSEEYYEFTKDKQKVLGALAT